MKRILYLSVHEILEYDELKLFSELGYECFSLGAYTQPGGVEHRKRPPLELPYNPHFIELALQYPKENLHPEMLEGIDIVIIMHDTKLVTNNWPLLQEFIKKGGRVIWRSIGQSIGARENEIKVAKSQGLEIVRYSPAERTIPGYVGEDAMIRFYKDPDEYKGWTGSRHQVINFTQSLKQRGSFTGYRLLRKVFADMPAKVYGPGNEDLGMLNGGLVSYDQQLDLLQKSRVFFYHGTYPASYTLSFIEAMMTGTPIVAVGPKNGNSYDMFPGQDTYEVHDIIQNGVNGYWSDNVMDIRNNISHLLNDARAAKAISAFGRSRAIELFGKAKIAEEWKRYLEQ